MTSLVTAVENRVWQSRTPDPSGGMLSSSILATSLSSIFLPLSLSSLWLVRIRLATFFLVSCEHLSDNLSRMVSQVSMSDWLPSGSRLQGMPVWHGWGSHSLQRSPCPQNGVKPRGRLESFNSDWIDSQHPAILANNFSYSPSGNITNLTYGNGITTNRTFNSVNQIKTIQYGTMGNPEKNGIDTLWAKNGRILEGLVTRNISQV